MRTRWKAERWIYLALCVAFLITAAFPICRNGGSTVSYYQAVFSSATETPFDNLFLAVPGTMMILNVILLLAEIISKTTNQSLEWAVRSFGIFFEIFGLVYAVVAGDMMPFGIVIIVYGLAFLISLIVFHYGIKKMNI